MLVSGAEGVAPAVLLSTGLRCACARMHACMQRSQLQQGVWWRYGRGYGAVQQWSMCKHPWQRYSTQQYMPAALPCPASSCGAHQVAWLPAGPAAAQPAASPSAGTAAPWLRSCAARQRRSLVRALAWMLGLASTLPLLLGTRRRSSAVPSSCRAGPRLGLVVDTRVGEAAGARVAAAVQLRQRHKPRMGMCAAAMVCRVRGIQEQWMLHHCVLYRVGTEGAD